MNITGPRSSTGAVLFAPQGPLYGAAVSRGVADCRALAHLRAADVVDWLEQLLLGWDGWDAGNAAKTARYKKCEIYSLVNKWPFSSFIYPMKKT